VFIEPRFVVLVALCWITLSVVPARFRAHALAGWGVVFYALFALPVLWLIAGVVLVAYVCVGRRSKWIGITLLVGLLAYFKRPLGLTGGAAGALAPLVDSPFVPLGFSYLALELIHYMVERSRGRIVDRSLPNLAAFALFFPCRVAGPIKRYGDFTASVTQGKGSAEDVYRGCFRILAGLFKKVVLADLLNGVAATIDTAATSPQAWKAMAAYSLALYMDFSAYSDFAIGVSRVMGVRVPENFNWPYLSTNIQDFWNRWHMSLSSWVRDYVFTGVGRQLFKTGLRARPGAIATASYFATFLVVGAWHGLAPNFLVWGAYHGLLVTIFHFYKAWLPDAIASSAWYSSRLMSAGSAVLTFALVTIGLVFFRMDVNSAVRVLRLMLVG
jgi:alginate O-acetyltransferase complex protein AlgI